MASCNIVSLHFDIVLCGEKSLPRARASSGRCPCGVSRSPLCRTVCTRLYSLCVQRFTHASREAAPYFSRQPRGKQLLSSVLHRTLFLHACFAAPTTRQPAERVPSTVLRKKRKQRHFIFRRERHARSIAAEVCPFWKSSANRAIVSIGIPAARRFRTNLSFA